MLGKTKLNVSRIGFGGIPIQRINEESSYELVLEALKSGINFFDTARGYTVSEQFIGNSLAKIKDIFPRNTYYLATKSMARTYEGMKKDIEQSLLNLQTDYIDLYQVHNVKTKEELNQIMSGAYIALKEAKDKGLIKHIGITSHSLKMLEDVLDLDLFSTIQFPYNVLETEAENLFIKAKQLNIGVIVMKPLAGGAINNPKLALKFILNNPNVSVVIPGMANVSEVKENTSVDAGEYSEEEIREISNIRKLLSDDFCRRCEYCKPCTVGIDIPNMFLFEGYYTRYNLSKWAKSRYDSQIVKAKDCIECGICISKCPYNLNIIEKLKKVSAIFD